MCATHSILKIFYTYLIQKADVRAILLPFEYHACGVQHECAAQYFIYRLSWINRTRSIWAAVTSYEGQSWRFVRYTRRHLHDACVSSSHVECFICKRGANFAKLMQKYQRSDLLHDFHCQLQMRWCGNIITAPDSANTVSNNSESLLHRQSALYVNLSRELLFYARFISERAAAEAYHQRALVKSSEKFFECTHWRYWLKEAGALQTIPLRCE